MVDHALNFYEHGKEPEAYAAQALREREAFRKLPYVKKLTDLGVHLETPRFLTMNSDCALVPTPKGGLAIVPGIENTGAPIIVELTADQVTSVFNYAIYNHLGLGLPAPVEHSATMIFPSSVQQAIHAASLRNGPFSVNPDWLRIQYQAHLDEQAEIRNRLNQGQQQPAEPAPSQTADPTVQSESTVE